VEGVEMKGVEVGGAGRPANSTQVMKNSNPYILLDENS